ncbi:MAG: hypothetical protein AAGJ35_04370, partial [Myxococcota bacterium]
WRIGIKQNQASFAQNYTASASPETLLASAVTSLQSLQTALHTLDHSDLCTRVDHVLTESVLPLAEGRQRILDQWGMRQGAEILVTLAFGERMLNRVWSAASDGHLPEARNVLQDAHDAFIEAQQQMQADS